MRFSPQDPVANCMLFWLAPATTLHTLRSSLFVLSVGKMSYILMLFLLQFVLGNIQVISKRLARRVSFALSSHRLQQPALPVSAAFNALYLFFVHNCALSSVAEYWLILSAFLLKAHKADRRSEITAVVVSPSVALPYRQHIDCQHYQAVGTVLTLMKERIWQADFLSPARCLICSFSFAYLYICVTSGCNADPLLSKLPPAILALYLFRA